MNGINYKKYIPSEIIVLTEMKSFCNVWGDKYSRRITLEMRIADLRTT